MSSRRRTGQRGLPISTAARGLYSIDAFECVFSGNFSYPQPWVLPDRGFLFLHTRYGGAGLSVHAQRTLSWMTSGSGKDWSAGQALAAMAMGDYQISWPWRGRLGTALDYHPAPLGLNGRANIYYLQTEHFGRTWTTAGGTVVSLPLTNRNNTALIYDSERDRKLVYLKDLNYDAKGRPVILFLTSKGYEAGPENGPREWKTTRWTGQAWETRLVTTSDNNYDHGSLYIEPDGAWRIIAPTEPGPQRFNPGGEMVMWLSRDQGEHWTRVKQLTRGSKFNHTYARRPLDAQPGFYAIWADGHARQPSTSSLYFTDRDGTHVWRLPAEMTGETAEPEVAWE